MPYLRGKCCTGPSRATGTATTGMIRTVPVGVVCCYAVLLFCSLEVVVDGILFLFFVLFGFGLVGHRYLNRKLDQIKLFESS